MGALRVATSNPVVDPATRLLGWMIRGELPAGLADMSPASTYLNTANAFEGAGSAAAGSVGHDYRIDTYGLAFLDGFAERAFEEALNDRVVSAESATSGVSRSEQIECDHFSYLLDADVQRLIADAIKRLPQLYVELQSEERRPRPAKSRQDTLTW